MGTPVATLSGAWRYRVSAGTGRPGVSILWLGEVESLICNLYLSVAARKIVRADPSPRYTSLLLGRQASKQATNKQSLQITGAVGLALNTNNTDKQTLPQRLGRGMVGT